MALYKKVFIFISLLIFSNLFLLRKGLWLFQDAAYWPKTSQEASMMINQQIHSFTNYGYYLGFDPGLFNFTRIEVYLLSGLLYWAFGSGGSQAALSIFGSAMSFLSMYLMTGIFFKSKDARFLLSLLYVFSPTMYSLQGHTYYGITIPLFIYSFYQLFKKESKGKLIYLLLNVVSVFFWIAYIRFIPITAIVTIPIVVYLLLTKQIVLTVKRTVLYTVSYILLLSPVLYSFVSQLIEGADTAFNYRLVYGQAVAKLEFFEAFNPFVNLSINIYTHPIYVVIGLLLNVFIIWLIWSYKPRERSIFWLLNLAIVLFGIFTFGLANILGVTGYKDLIKYFPFVINGPLFAFFITSAPLALLLGKLTDNRTKYLYIFVGVAVCVGILPLININKFELSQTDLNQIPEPYQRYFIRQYFALPEATYYLYSTCWRARYMDDLNIPTGCYNFGLHYSSISLNDPRLASGTTYQFAQNIFGDVNVDNLRITHNLKHIIVPNDMVLKNGPGSNTSETDLEMIPVIQKAFEQNTQLISHPNDNFIDYSYLNKNDYDFLLYAPKTTYPVDVNKWLSEHIDIYKVPVLVEKNGKSELSAISAPTIHYKANPNNPGTYYLKVTNISPDKPFLLQLNQAYLKSWQIKSISKQDFENVKCKSEWKYFSITNNYSCLYNDHLIDLNFLKFIQSHPVSAIHQTGNLLSNLWTINNSSSEEYFLVTYQKQDLYTIAILISIGSLILLIFGVLMQEITLKKYKHG